MSINFNFNSLNSLFSGNGSGGMGLAGLLGDYASIKNGSYGRLMRAYYKETGSSSSNKTSSTSKKSVAERIIDEKMARERKVETAESKAYTQVKGATNNLKAAANKLSPQGSSSLFEKKNIATTDENGLESFEYDYDKEAIYSAVSNFVKEYNSVLTAAGSVGNSSIANRVTSMENNTYTNRDALKQFGVTINANNTLSIDKDTFMKADMGQVERTFKDTGYATSVAASASMINYNANYEQLRANTYTYDGTFDSTYNTGSSYNSSL